MKNGGMKTAAVLGALLVISAAVLGGCSASSDGAANLAPDFSGVALDGTQVSMDEYRGKPLVLAFMASW